MELSFEVRESSELRCELAIGSIQRAVGSADDGRHGLRRAFARRGYVPRQARDNREVFFREWPDYGSVTETQQEAVCVRKSSSEASRLWIVRCSRNALALVHESLVVQRAVK